MKPTTFRPFPSLALAGAFLLFSSCGGSDSPTDPDDGGNNTPAPTVASVTALSAPGEQTVGATVTVDFRVDGSDGQPFSGASVAFSASAGSVTPASANSSASGAVSTSWTLGTAVGSQTLTATAAGRTATVTVTTRAGAAAAFEKVSGDGQTGAAGSTLDDPIVVILKDAFGNPVGGETLSATVTAGGGSLEGATGTTGIDGRASFLWRLGDPGAQTLTVTHAVGTLSFSATAQAGAPAAISKVAGDNQSATVGTTVSTAPQVLVTDAQGNTVGGVSVTFAVASGGGSVTGGTATTASDGTASVGSWTLGSSPGTNTLSAMVSGLAAVTFTAEATAASGSNYTIDLRYIGTMSSSVQAAFEGAKARWEQIITGDLPNSTVNSTAGECTDNQPAINETIDDLLIFAEVAAIDGSGGTLGQAGPCYIRTSSGLALMGTMTFDEADLADMEQDGTLSDVIIHEMGHVLGIGTLWEHRSLLQGAGTDDPFFSGTNGVAGYQTLGGVVTNGIPVENTGEEGTRDGHWRESIFQNELMTGYVSDPGNPISIMTVRSLVDHGYEVNNDAADTYSIPSPASPVASAVRRAAEKWERLLKPIAAVSPNGTRFPIR